MDSTLTSGPNAKRSNRRKTFRPDENLNLACNVTMTSKNLIYALIDPRTDAVRYIGKSTRGLNRPKTHTTPSVLAKDRTYKGNWIRSLAALGAAPKVRVLEEFQSKEELPYAECFWIAQGRGLEWPLTNLTDGGEGCVGRVVTEKQRAHLSAVHAGKSYHTVVHTDESKAKIRAAHLGVKQTPEHVEANRRGHLGHVVSAEARVNQSKAMRGHVTTAATRAKIGAANAVALKGRKLSPEHASKKQTAQKGLKRSPEICEKFRAIWAARKAKRAALNVCNC